jgi:hypothetical protein
VSGSALAEKADKNMARKILARRRGFMTWNQ